MIKKLPIKIKHLVRSFSPEKYSLPQFLIIGAQKAGTSSLFSYLNQHPEVMAATRKEAGFFSKKYSKGSSWYRTRFPSKENIKSGYISGEATPEYFFHPHAAKRISHLLPDIRLILILRNPVERAISHYYHSVKIAYEKLALEDALNAEDQRIRKVSAEMTENEKIYSLDWQNYSYKSRGIYSRQLGRYLDYFTREQILIIHSKELFESPNKVMKKVQNHLGISGFEGFEFSIKNEGRYRQSTVPDSVYFKLADYFRAYNEELFEMTGIDYGWSDATQTYRTVHGTE